MGACEVCIRAEEMGAGSGKVSMCRADVLYLMCMTRPLRIKSGSSLEVEHQARWLLELMLFVG